MNNKKNTKKNRQNFRENLSTDSRKSRKQKSRQRIVVVISSIIFALLVLAIALFIKGCSDIEKNTGFIGVWQYDQYTEYEFKDSNIGCMCLDSDTHYEFTYSIKENVLYIDFVMDYVTDCQYTYNLKGDKLTLVGGKGTAEVGKTYELSRVK